MTYARLALVVRTAIIGWFLLMIVTVPLISYAGAPASPEQSAPSQPIAAAPEASPLALIPVCPAWEGRLLAAVAQPEATPRAAAPRPPGCPAPAERAPQLAESMPGQ